MGEGTTGSGGSGAAPSPGDRIFAILGRSGRGGDGADGARRFAGYTIAPGPPLGSGTFGDVFRARDDNLPRDVAIKVLREGPQPDRVRRERMNKEVRALAELQGTEAGRHIVEIYSRSPPDDRRFYLVLELVEGKSLADRLARPGPLPAAREAAALVHTIARVMHEVHQRDIIHRDLKPSNILLADGDHPKITDFGLAGFADDHDLTRDGEPLGTPSYMPPEQARGRVLEVDRVSDVYSIGAILYECLAGTPPFRGASDSETIQLILGTSDPAPPERLVPSVPRDLSTIALKCLERRKDQRYATAAELAADLDRFLQGQPILARRASRIERAAKWARRNPQVAGLGAAVIVSVLLGVTASLLYANRAIIHERRAVQQERRANRNAELRFAALEKVLTTVTDNRLRLAGQRPLQVELINDLLPRFEEVLAIEGDDPPTRQLQGLAWINLSRIRRDLGHYPEALAAARRGGVVFRRLLGAGQLRAEAEVGLGTALGFEAAMLGMGGKTPEAIAAAQEAVGLLQPHSASAPAILERLAHVRNNWANTLRFGVRTPAAFAEADQLYRQAVADFAGGAATLRTCRDWEARTLSNRALLLGEALKRPAEAIPLGLEAVKVARELVPGHEDDIDGLDCLATCLTNAGEFELKHGDATQATAMFREVLQLYEKLAARVPSSADFRWGVAMTLSNLGQALLQGRTPDPAAAVDMFRRAEEIYRKLVAEVRGDDQLADHAAANRERLLAAEAGLRSQPSGAAPGTGQEMKKQ